MIELYRRLFDELPCYVTVQDKRFRLIATNRMFQRDFVVGPDAHCYEVYKGRTEKCVDCPVEKTFRDGHTHSSEEVVRRKGGDEVHVIVHTSPLRKSNGVIDGVVEISTDITEVKRLQQKYHALFEEAPCYISVQDRDLKILEANRRFRKDFGNPNGGYCYDVYKHRSEPCLTCPVAETFQDGRSHQSEEVVTSREGCPANVLVHTAAVRNNVGHIDSVIEMSTNITDVRELQSQLTSLGLIVGSVSHGIKGLLSGLDGGIYLMKTGFKNEKMDRVENGWDMIQRNVDRIRSMVLNILYYAKDREVYLQPIDVEEITTSVGEIVSSRAESVGVELSVEAEAGTFKGDQNSVHSMLVNLVENSIDACRIDKEEDDHRVGLRARLDGEHVVFEIEDNGIGMDRETKEKAFSLFFSSKGAEGTGLGLFIANKIVNNHGGSIEIESSPGTGTRFLVRLPMNPPAESPSALADVEEVPTADDD